VQMECPAMQEGVKIGLGSVQDGDGQG
jgi:hypothetical protein